MMTRPLFWLHIKKSAGISTRKLLKPHYVEVDRTHRPQNFTQADPSHYNDILNNYRVVLGEYQFRRAQFARDYLYPKTWDNTFSFAFSREPTSRVVSMFHYLYLPETSRYRVRATIRNYVRTGSVNVTTRTAFDQFLGCIEKAQNSPSIFSPIDLHFTTHTARMWEDITDSQGNILLSRVYRLEHMSQALNSVFEQCGIKKRIDTEKINVRLNQRTDHQHSYQPNRRQAARIQQLFYRDFELYESGEKN